MNMTADNNLFQTLVRKLTAGEIICPHSNEYLYEYLQDPAAFDDLDRYLQRMGLTLGRTNDDVGIYAMYLDLNSPSEKLEIKRLYAELINELEPLIRWLSLAKSIEKSGAPLQPGETLLRSELFSAIEGDRAPALIEELERLSRTKLFHNTATGPTKQLEAILKKLSDKGYLIPRGTGGTVYVASGKWSRLYDMLQFIATNEQLDDSEEEDVAIQETLEL